MADEVAWDTLIRKPIELLGEANELDKFGIPVTLHHEGGDLYLEDEEPEELTELLHACFHFAIEVAMHFKEQGDKESLFPYGFVRLLNPADADACMRDTAEEFDKFDNLRCRPDFAQKNTRRH